MSSVEYPISLLSSLFPVQPLNTVGGVGRERQGQGQIVIPLTEPFFSAYPCFICVLKIRYDQNFKRKMEIAMQVRFLISQHI